MATPAATYCNVGSGAGQNHYEISYSLQDGSGITTLGQTAFAASTGVVSTNSPATNIIGDSPDGMMLLRADVDQDPIASNGYPRTESRELATDGTTKRAFDANAGEHWIKVVFKVLHLPPKKPSVVVVQIHDDVQDIMEFAVQPVTGYDEITNPKMELVCRINGTSSGVPKLVADFKLNTVYVAKIRVGAIGPASAIAWEAYIGDMTTPKIKSSDAGMVLLSTTGAVSYFKWGAYLQTKHTGNGTGGLETDINEYGETGYRDVQTFHNGETAPAVLTFGTQVYDAVSNVRWGVATEFQNDGSNTPLNITPALPASLVNGDMMYAVLRARRTASALPSTSIPASTTTPTGWTRIISTKSVTTPTNLVAHNIRFALFVKKWVNGDVAPTFTYTSATNTDLVTIQIFAVAESKYSTDLLNVLDVEPAGLDLTNPNDNNTTTTGVTYAAAASTTTVGPTGTLTAAPGSLALALVAHEISCVTTAAVGVVTGGADALTWVEGGEGVLLTTAGMAWANDYAIVPGSGSAVSIGAKSAAATLTADADPVTAGTQNGKGWGLLFSLAAAKKHGRRRAN